MTRPPTSRSSLASLATPEARAFAGSLATFAALLAGTGCSPAADPGAPEDPAPRSSSFPLAAVPASRLCVTSGRIDQLDARTLMVDIGGMRAVVAGDSSRTAELGFTYRGPSSSTALLADGELRRQIGIKLNAKDTCNVVYVMWHVEPTPTIAVSVKYNPGMSRDEECGAGGYHNLIATRSMQPAPIHAGEAHTLRAELDGETLTVIADGSLAWQGTLPAELRSFAGPAGIRSDNGTFDFELSVPGGDRNSAVCSSP